MRLKAAFEREDVFVVSKAGYVQGSNLKLARERIQAAKPYPRDGRADAPDCWHCIAPEFLADQITASARSPPA